MPPRLDDLSRRPSQRAKAKANRDDDEKFANLDVALQRATETYTHLNRPDELKALRAAIEAFYPQRDRYTFAQKLRINDRMYHLALRVNKWGKATDVTRADVLALRFMCNDGELPELMASTLETNGLSGWSHLPEPKKGGPALGVSSGDGEKRGDTKKSEKDDMTLAQEEQHDLATSEGRLNRLVQTIQETGRAANALGRAGAEVQGKCATLEEQARQLRGQLATENATREALESAMRQFLGLEGSPLS